MRHEMKQAHVHQQLQLKQLKHSFSLQLIGLTTSIENRKILTEKKDFTAFLTEYCSLLKYKTEDEQLHLKRSKLSVKMKTNRRNTLLG